MTQLIHFHEYRNRQQSLSVSVFPTDSFEIIKSKIGLTSDPNDPFFVKFPMDMNLNLIVSNKLTILNLNKLNVFQVKIGEEHKIYFDPKSIRDIAKQFKFTTTIHQDNNHELFYCLLLKLICSLSEIRELNNEKKKKKKIRLPSSSTKKRSVPSRSLETLIESRPPPSSTIPLSVPRRPVVETSSAPRRPAEGSMVSLKSPIVYDMILRYHSDIRLRAGFISFLQNPYVVHFIEQMRSMKDFVPTNLNLRNTDIILNKLVQFSHENTKMMKLYHQHIENGRQVHENVERLVPMEYTPIQYDGRVLRVRISTDEFTTGILFDQLVLGEYFPVAQFQSFLKLHDSCPKSIPIPSAHDDRLYLYHIEKNGEVVPHVIVKNKKGGIELEILILASSEYETVPSLLEFLTPSLQKEQIQSTVQMGLIGRFEFLNCSFQNYLLADMIMNDPTFAAFFMLNDSDKISKDNQSIYIYFQNLLEGQRNNNDVLEVGDWNREQSRFGQLTASLYPYIQDGKDFIQVKVHRARNERTLLLFQHILSRLLRLYEELKLQTLSYFRSYIPNMREHPIENRTVSSKSGSLGYKNKVLFPSEYVRCCQGNRKPVLLSSLREVEELQLTPTQLSFRVLKYPLEPIEFEGQTIEPAYYYAKNETEPYIGYIHMRSLQKKHPLQGYVPCTFTRPQLAKNVTIEKRIYENEVIQKKSKNVIAYKTKKKKVMSNTGQLGALSKTLEKFFYLLEPNEKFVHIGISDQHVSSSLLYACHYALMGNLEDISPTIRQDILHSVHLNTGTQENYMTGLSSLREILETETVLDVRQFYTIIENYFSIQLIVFTPEGEMVTPNSAYSFQYFFRQTKPYVLLLEHASPVRYEVIGMEGENSVQTKFMQNESLPFEQIRNILLQTYNKNEINLPSVKDTILVKIFQDCYAQTCNKSGQCVLLHAHWKGKPYMVYYEIPIAPITVPIKNQPFFDPPTYSSIRPMLSSLATDNVLSYYLFEKTSFGMVRWAEGCIPFRVDSKTNIQDWETIDFHPLLFYIQPSTSNISSFLDLYITVKLIKNYLLLLLEKNIPIDTFKQNFLEFVPKKTFKNKSLSCQRHKNQWLFSNDVIKIPNELKSIIQYFLEWNQECNEEGMRKIKDTIQLDYYQFATQFQQFPNNSVQTDPVLYKNYTYENFYTFSLQSIPRNIPTFQVFYRYVPETDLFNPFFLLPKTNETVVDYEMQRIKSMMHVYYRDHILHFSIQDFVDTDSYKDRYEIHETSNFFFVSFQFI